MLFCSRVPKTSLIFFAVAVILFCFYICSPPPSRRLMPSPFFYFGYFFPGLPTKEEDGRKEGEGDKGADKGRGVPPRTNYSGGGRTAMTKPKRHRSEERTSGSCVRKKDVFYYYILVFPPLSFFFLFFSFREEGKGLLSCSFVFFPFFFDFSFVFPPALLTFLATGRVCVCGPSSSSSSPSSYSSSSSFVPLGISVLQKKKRAAEKRSDR